MFIQFLEKFQGFYLKSKRSKSLSLQPADYLLNLIP